MSYHSRYFEPSPEQSALQNWKRCPVNLVTSFARPNAVVMLCPLPRSGGLAVFSIGYDPNFTVHPVAVFDQAWQYKRIPTAGLRPSSRSDFLYEVEPDKPLRTAADPRDLAIRWATIYVDDEAATRH